MNLDVMKSWLNVKDAFKRYRTLLSTMPGVPIPYPETIWIQHEESHRVVVMTTGIEKEIALAEFRLLELRLKNGGPSELPDLTEYEIEELDDHGGVWSGPMYEEIVEAFMKAFTLNAKDIVTNTIIYSDDGKEVDGRVVYADIRDDVLLVIAEGYGCHIVLSFLLDSIHRYDVRNKLR